MLTETHLQLIMPNLPPARRKQYFPLLGQVLEIYEIDTALRAAAFLAQLAHESAEFRYMEEIWGPTTAQRRYEPPGDLARRLGNTEPGDGRRFKGRGPIQITGRYNYKKYGDLLGLDLVGSPELAATPAVAFSIAGLFWKSNGLNALADKDDFVTITRRINGGTNGLAERQRYYARARQVLGLGFTQAPVLAAPRALPVRAAAPVRRSRAALSRGQEERIAVLGAAALKRPALAAATPGKAAAKAKPAPAARRARPAARTVAAKKPAR